MKTTTTLQVLDRILFTITLILLGVACCMGQNLVKNPSFEDYLACPNEYGSFQKDLNSWYKPTQGSTDYFNACGDKLSTGVNFIGQQEAFEGNAFAGFYALGPNGYREYIAGELLEKLEKGKKYNFSFRISLAEKSQFAIDEMGLLFTHELMHLRTKKNISSNVMRKNGLNGYVRIKNQKYFSNKDDWMEVSGEYVADGTEKFFVFGNFKSNTGTRKIEVAKNLKKASYYYIDMVSVIGIDNGIKLDETYVLENLFFEVNGHQIIGEGKKELQKLVDHLIANPSLNISIYGHTDNIGLSSHNKELSQKRAQEVGLFLLENGLETTRIAWKGFGDMLPLAQNDTEEGRRKNRRVEFVVSKKPREFYASGIFEEDF